MRKILYDRADGESYEVEQFAGHAPVGSVLIHSKSHGFEMITKALWDQLEVVEMAGKAVTDTRHQARRMSGVPARAKQEELEDRQAVKEMHALDPVAQKIFGNFRNDEEPPKDKDFTRPKKATGGKVKGWFDPACPSEAIIPVGTVRRVLDACIPIEQEPTCTCHEPWNYGHDEGCPWKAWKDE